MAVTGDDWLAAQYSVLGSALISPEVIPKIMAETSAQDYTGACLTVYKAIRKLFLAGTAVDPVSVSGVLGSGYREFLVQLMEVTPTAANIDHYIALCREQARVIAIRELAQQMTTADTSDKLRALLEQASSLMVDKPSLRISTMSDSLHSFMERHTKPAHYLTWPVRELNDRLYAELGDLIVIGGYPSSGKSAWALQCAWHLAKDYKVGFFSLETSSEKLFDRQMASVVQLSMDEIKRNDIPSAGWDKVAAMSSEIVSRHLELIPAAGMTPADVRAVIQMRGYQVVIIDYLQLLQGSGENRTAMVTGISIALHTIAQSMGVTVFALSQLSRQGQQNKNAPPDMSALRESGQIEQDADIVMLLSLADKGNPASNRELRIRKNKEGTCPSIMLAFDGKHQTFSKAQGDLLGKLVAEGKKAKRRTAPPQEFEQLHLLPSDTPTPFSE